MPIDSSELKFYKPKVVTDDGTNGGRISANEIITNTLQNTFANAFSAERAAGSEKHRKIGCKVVNGDSLTLSAAFVRLFDQTPADDTVFYHIGTHRDTQADIVGTEEKFGVARLAVDVAAGATALSVDVQMLREATGVDALFAAGKNIVITDKLTYNATAGNIEERVIDVISSVVGNRVTFTVTEALTNAYTVVGVTKVESLPAKTDVLCSHDNWDKTSIGTTTVDEVTAGNIVLNNPGTVEQTVACTMTGATTFTMVSDDPDVTLGSGDIGTDFAPVNPATSQPYLTVKAGTIAGSPVSGDSFSFQTHPAIVNVWETRVLPVDCGPLTGNKVTLVFGGESA